MIASFASGVSTPTTTPAPSMPMLTFALVPCLDIPKAPLSTCPDISLGNVSTRHCVIFLLRGKDKASLFSITNLNCPLIHTLRSSELNNSDH